MATITITKDWVVSGVLTTATVKLSDPHGTYGVRRNDTGGVVVADATAMVESPTGVFTYTFTAPASGLTYTAWIEVVYDGKTYYYEQEISAGGDTGLGFTFLDLKKAIAHHLGWTRDYANWTDDKETNLREVVRSGLRQVYYPLPIEPNRPAHKWSFFYPLATFTTTAPYSTGTVTIADGVVTLSAAGTFPSWAASGELTVNGVSYTVASWDGDNQVTLDDTSVTEATASAYVLAQTAYDLPSDFGGFLGEMTYDPGISTLWPALQFTSEGEMRRRKQNDTTTARPRWYAYRPKTFVAATGQRYETILYPSPNGAYRLSYRYKVQSSMLSADDEYPLGGPELTETILESCLAIADERFNEGGGGIHKAKFMECLMGAIQLDQDRSTPDYMGYNADHSDDPDDERRTRQISPSLLCKYEGNIYY